MGLGLGLGIGLGLGELLRRVGAGRGDHEDGLRGEAVLRVDLRRDEDEG